MNLIRASVVGCGMFALAAAPPARKEAPQFWGHSASGDVVHLADRTPRGKWVLVEFWSSGAAGQGPGGDGSAARKVLVGGPRLLLFSVCVDLDFGDWLDHVNRQADLDNGRGGKVSFYSDRRWWQMSLGVRREEERTAFIKSLGLGKMPAYFLIRPGGAQRQQQHGQGEPSAACHLLIASRGQGRHAVGR
jgi:hypothetical protein